MYKVCLLEVRSKERARGLTSPIRLYFQSTTTHIVHRTVEKQTNGVRSLLFVVIYRENATLGGKSIAKHPFDSRSFANVRCDFFSLFFSEERVRGCVRRKFTAAVINISRAGSRSRWPTIFRPTRGKQFYANVRIFFCFRFKFPLLLLLVPPTISHSMLFTRVRTGWEFRVSYEMAGSL